MSGFCFRSGVHQDKAGRRVQVRPRFVHGNVAFAADTHQYDVHATESLETLFVQAAVFKNRFLLDASVDGEYILLVDVNLVNEQVLEL